MDKETVANLRIDKWLWFTRFYKTRALAAKAVAAGHVRINGVRAKPSATVMPGAVIDLVRNQLPYRLVAGTLPQRRRPAVEARQAYAEDEVTRNKREQIAATIRLDRLQLPRTDGKPDKHTRRQIRIRRRSDGG